MDEIVAFATGFGSSTHHTQSPKPRPKPRLNTTITQPPTNHNPTLSNPTSSNPIPSNFTTPDHPIPHYILFTSQPKHSIYLSIHTHPYTDAYTLTRLIVNKLLTLYISIDILTFMWYNQDNGEGPFYMLNI